MIKVALKGLAGRKVRALLTALAVVIGVSMVSGTFVLTDTMQKAFDGIFEESYEGTDAVVNGKQLVEFSTGGRATVPAVAAEGHRGPPRRRRGRGLPAGPAEQLQPRQAARQQGRDHRPRGRDDGRRHRRGRPPVLPAQAQAGRLGGRRRRDRPRRRDGEQAGLRRSATRSRPPPPARPGRSRSRASPPTGPSTRWAASRSPSSTSRRRRPCSARKAPTTASR